MAWVVVEPKADMSSALRLFKARGASMPAPGPETRIRGISSGRYFYQCCFEICELWSKLLTCSLLALKKGPFQKPYIILI